MENSKELEQLLLSKTFEAQAGKLAVDGAITARSRQTCPQ